MRFLDDPANVLRHDPKGMYGLFCAFPEQIERAVEIARAAPLPRWGAKPDLALLTGLGGSAAGGDFVRCLFEAQARAPFLVNRDYHLPTFVGPGALVFACSYSGNTEETLSAYADAKRRGASIVAVTSGGRLAELAGADGFPLILVPAGQPPRTALGYLLMPVVVACAQMGLIPEADCSRLVAFLKGCVAAWSLDAPFEANPTKRLAQALHGRLAVLYGLGSWQAAVANRWKGQINENAKVMAFCNAFPELNHNEILGWVKAGEQGVARWAAVVLEDGTESPKMRKRAEVTLRLIEPVCETHRVQAPGSTLLERMLGLALYGDFVSVYLAALNEVDPENIDWIDVLKAELAQAT
jgi:glucose/mannose-6-phosphate isomerase